MKHSNKPLIGSKVNCAVGHLVTYATSSAALQREVAVAVQLNVFRLHNKETLQL